MGNNVFCFIKQSHRTAWSWQKESCTHTNTHMWKLLSCVWLSATPWATVHGILQDKTLEWVAFPFSRGSSQPSNQTGSRALQADSLSTELSGKPIYIFTYISIFFPIMFVVVLVFRMVRDYCSTLMRVVTFMYAWAVPSCNCPGRVTLTRGLIRAPYLDPEWQSSFLSLT